ncbi:MAG: ergothioneine biosynthesis protein EgtB [Myxococcales bacterium]
MLLSAMTESLRQALVDSRARTLALTSDLDDAQWVGPRLPIVNPILWELGHLAWFQEYWTLRRARGRPPRHAQGDALYDSAKVAHDTRWDLPLLPRAEVLSYLSQTLAASLAALGTDPDRDAYFHRLALCHEDMHGEALVYTRQTLRYPAPPGVPPAPAAGSSAAPGLASPGSADASPAARQTGPLPGDVEIPGARFLLGAPRGSPFVFDNEKWAHPVEVERFRIARAPVTNGQLAEFVEAGGYRDDRFWSAEGARARAGLDLPAYWQRAPGGGFLERRFQTVAPIRPHCPAIHLSWFEAEAYCRWAGRRLPTEAEWELAAATPEGRTFPWGEAAPDPDRANLDGARGGVVDVAAHPAGDSANGCRQMIGNVWEWTATDFQPYPGFVADPYKEYSEPWFASPHKVLRGGCWATRGRLLRNTFRNFYPPDRRDVLAGFRTCAR